MEVGINKMKKNSAKIDKGLIIVSLILIFSIVIYLAAYPEQGTQAANKLFTTATNGFGSATLLFGFLSVMILGWLAISKYGNIKLGHSKPEFSTYSWIAMMLSAGLGSATVYWAFLEWGYYYMTPPFGVEPFSNAAYEWATTYNFFHWGITAWGLYCIAALPVAYHFHVRKNKGLSLSAVIEAITGFKKEGPVGRVVDFMFIFTVFGALGITLGLSIPMVATGIAKVLGVQHNFMMNVAIVLAISAIYSFSSYIGIEKGMRRISDLNTYFAIGFALFILIVGPTLFIIDSTTNAIGQMFQNYFKMSLWTDHIGNSGFPEGWTIFYWLYWITYTPFMGVFVTKISKGRKIKEVIANMLISGSAGCWFFFGIIGNYSLHAHKTGKVDVAGLLGNGQDYAAIMNVMDTLPLSSLAILFFTVISILFLATTLDSASYTLAATATRGLKEDEDPSPFHRLFWCVMLAVVPLTMMFIDAPLNTIKTCAIVTAVPLTLLLCVQIFGLFKWIFEDYGDMPSFRITEENMKKDEVKKYDAV